MNTINLTDTSRPFLAYLEDWYRQLPPAALADIVGGAPERVALISIDVINGFCVEGPLASARVGRVAQPVAALFRQAYALGVRHFALTQDTHAPDAPEFGSYPPHCLRGTAESQAVDELRELPFYSEIAIFPKNSINSHFGTGLGAWLRANPQLDRFVVVGDCSDLCAYQAAMHLRLEAGAANQHRRVIVPADAVETFDTPVEVARALGIRAHDGDLHHVLFLHHMAMNGVEVVATLSE
ncbi:MAG TPA: isochorismatase family cysteine hydrolase [Kouleothrix sp.]|uniref:cysteine hydrolase family protein n=1 Tax=Kouleothrix sp. TaxID=2779161 RepID=UPI002B8879AD|nr:isochorismatase family cysteine hydrolase [Kouleothrix sp.]HRC77875.1 isochorismatase family cysteine hydrolase [Kouleothrix sp.]